MKFGSIKLILPAILSMSVLAGCGETEEEEKIPTVTEYYSSIDFTMSGSLLVEKLHKLMWSTHVNEVRYVDYMSYESNVAEDLSHGQKAQDSIDLIPGTNFNESFYSGKRIGQKQGNREHVWPCANSNGLWDHDVIDNNSKYVGGGSDLYHVRPCNSYTNTLRGNSKFVDFDDFPGATPTSYNYEGVGAKPVLTTGESLNTKTNKMEYATNIEVDDSMKGDVARILAYLWLHYNRNTGTPENKKNYVAKLSFMNVVGYSTEDACKDKLIEWNNLDRVSEVEKHRNDTVQKIQGNRNPFVDHPELMEKCFQEFVF